MELRLDAAAAKRLALPQRIGRKSVHLEAGRPAAVIVRIARRARRVLARRNRATVTVRVMSGTSRLAQQKVALRR